MLALAALAGCGAGSGGNQTNGGAKVDDDTLTRLALSSPDFTEGQPIPVRFTCDGADDTPAIRWSEPPGGTKSFALVIDDPDAPSGTFRHWGIYDIPASARAIGGGERVGTEVTNDFGKSGYGGPCPPPGHGPHHYHFKLFALDTATLDLPGAAKVADVENAAKQHAIAQGELIGTYERN
jgi:Raf kinase inhibitor-like YbhB/YbcL family protein